MVTLRPEVRLLVPAIRNEGWRPMLVGGYVRNKLMGCVSAADDVDIEVYGDDVAVTRLAEVIGKAVGESADVGVIFEAGKSVAVLKVRLGDADGAIALPRREIKTGAGHCGFEVIADGTLSFREACARRSFTVNAFMEDPFTGEIFDFFGGRDDLEARVLRATSLAFLEDPLRVLRGMQFAARFGMWMGPLTAQLCRSLSDKFHELARERIWGEFWKLGTLGTDITAGLRALADSGWERHFPELTTLHGFEQDRRWHPEGDVHVHSGLAADQAARRADEAGLTGADRFVVVMAALCHDFGKPAASQLRLPCGLTVAYRRFLGPAVRFAQDRRLPLRITSHGHASAGVGGATAFLDSIGCPSGLAKRVYPP